MRAEIENNQSVRAELRLLAEFGVDFRRRRGNRLPWLLELAKSNCWFISKRRDVAALLASGDSGAGVVSRAEIENILLGVALHEAALVVGAERIRRAADSKLAGHA